MRRRREIIRGVAYHVCARANRQELILEDNQFKLMFLDVLKEAKKKYSFKLRNFCIMGNHVHLDIEPPEDVSISKIMQWVLSVFAVRYNRLFNYKGHVWYDRFKSKAIQTVRQLINTFIYIANNPVRANLTAHPLHFKFNGVSYLKNKHDPELLDAPQKWLWREFEDALKKYDPKNYLEIDEDLSFQPKKVGRKKK